MKIGLANRAHMRNRCSPIPSALLLLTVAPCTPITNGQTIRQYGLGNQAMMLRVDWNVASLVDSQLGNWKAL